MDSHTVKFDGVNSGCQVAVNNGVINHGSGPDSELFSLYQHVPIIEEALYDSHANENEDFCLDQTRTELLDQVKEWATSSDGKCILWLNGMAGTGKSTIARTVARSFKDNRLLGATYFFKRGEGDRDKAKYLIPSITRQLLLPYEQLVPNIKEVVNTNPWIASKALGEQFDKLLYRPLMGLELEPEQPTTIMIVIDALDECDGEQHTREIIRLLSKLKEVKSLRLRVFLTSRPEFPVRLGFRNNNSHRDIILHDLPAPVVRDDIRLFLRVKLTEIRDERSLPSDWPGDNIIEELVSMAVPLFVFAATAYRFVKNGRHPRKRLQQFLLSSTQNDRATQMDKIYLPVLNQLLDDDDDHDTILEEFQDIVGTIILLAHPLSIKSLSFLLDIPADEISDLLSPLHSVLSIRKTEDAPVRILHLSFHDYLLSPECPFHVEERRRHDKIASHCLRVMDFGLKRNICNFASFGIESNDIDSQIVSKHLTPVLQYACCYWVYHLQDSKDSFTQLDDVFNFLQKHFLHWLEALALIGKIFEAVTMIENLKLITSKNVGSRILSEFLADAKRFTLQISRVAAIAPLQLYDSGLVFAPTKSVIRETFGHEIARKLHPPPMMGDFWAPATQTLVGHSNLINSLAFSPDGHTLASGSADKTIKLWDTTNGAERQTLNAHCDDYFNGIRSIAFSPDGHILASTGKDIRLWDMTTGMELQTLYKSSDVINSIAFSPNGQTIAFSDCETVKLWNIASGSMWKTLSSHSGVVYSVAFSPDTHTLASSSNDFTIKLWEVTSGIEKQTLTGHSDTVSSVAFSPDGHILASCSSDHTILLWDMESNSVRHKLHFPSSPSSIPPFSMAFSPDGSRLASGSLDNNIRIWDTASGTEIRILQGHSRTIFSLAFSPDGHTIASGSADDIITLWNTAGTAEQGPRVHSGSFESLVLSPDNATLVSVFSDHTIKLWDTASGKERQTLIGKSDRVSSMTISSDGRTLATGSEDAVIKLWDTAGNGSELRTLEGHHGSVSSLALSLDSHILASSSRDATIKIWDTVSGAELKTLSTYYKAARSMLFSPNGHILATNESINSDSIVKIRDMPSGAERLRLTNFQNVPAPLAFTSDSQILASSADGLITLWDMNNGAAIQTIGSSSMFAYSLKLSCDDRTLMAESYDRTLELWDTASGAERHIPDDNFDLADSDPLANESEFQLSLADSCIRVSGQTPLWLPAEYRAFDRVAVQGTTLALGYHGGQVLIIGFKESGS